MLGYLWSLLKPLAIFVVLYFVFVKFLKFGAGIPHFAIYLLLGIVLWNYFLELTSGAIGSVVGKGDLLRKINFPKYVIVFASAASALINLTINFAIILVFMLIFGADPSWQAFIRVPLAILELTVWGLGIGLLLSTLFVRYRDIAYIWEVISQGMFYATPILYPLTMIPLAAQKILMINPVADAIQDARHYLVTPQALRIQDVVANPWVVYVPVVLSVAMFIVGAVYFRRRSRYFAEDV